VRPLGGYLADKYGSARLLSVLLFCVGTTYFLCSLLPELPIMSATLVTGMAFLGMGNGAVFQAVPQRFRQEVGVATGFVGAIGGLGGFLVPILLGGIKQSSGSFGVGFVVMAIVALAGAVVLRALIGLQRGWRVSWRAQGDEAFEES
jgi:NNP family nitrate/nitrite transporter-like MFS transporter